MYYTIFKTFTKTYYHYANNEMASITHIVDDRKTLNQYEYDVWGNVLSQKETLKNRFKFNGQQLDPITHQYYLRARFYNPIIVRFTQEDTYRGDGLNLYAYCANNPIYYVDPSGNSYDATKDIYGKLKNTQNFNPKAIEHIFEGEINKRGDVVGGHYEPTMINNENVKITKKGKPNENGVYSINFEINSTKKKGGSTVFPEDWTSQQVVDNINIAYENKVQIGDKPNKYEGSVNGIKIQMYVDNDGKIMTAFPKKKN